MKYPDFFNTIETITLQDPLSNFLGTFEDGMIKFSYLDVVKSAGHSCPTVAGAYIMCLVGLKALYKDEIAIRGDIHISFNENGIDGVSGVIANVFTQITGATANNGFKGINGNFARVGLMSFDQNFNADVSIQRLNTKQKVEILYDPSVLEENPQLKQLMGKVMKNQATNEEKMEFGKLWQEKVENIFNNIEKVISIK